MGKITCIYDRDVNYAFHMFSVARVGYDNEYGQKYRDRYSVEDLAILQKYKHELTMVGGDHDGVLFWIGMYAGSRTGEAITRIREQGGFEGFENYNEQLLEILGVFDKYYRDYCDNIWPEQEEKLCMTCADWQKCFDEERIDLKAEKYLGITVEEEFCPSLVTSVKDGAEAIMYNNCDVFNIERDFASARLFVAHEYIVYLLLSRFDYNEIRDCCYDAFEGLAEYYMETILGEDGFFREQAKYVEFYRENAKHAASVEELFEMGKKI